MTAATELKVTAQALNTEHTNLERFVPRGDYDNLLQRATNAEQQLFTVNTNAHRKAVELAITAATKSGKVTPATVEYHRTMCQDYEGLQRVNAYIAAAPIVAGLSGLHGRQPELSATALNAEEQAMCTQLGVDPDEFRKNKPSETCAMPLTEDRDTPMMATDLLALPVIGNVQIHAGSIVAVNADGLAVTGAIATDLTYVGRAEISVDTRGLTSGSKRIEVRRNRAFQWAQDGTIDQSHLFQIAYIFEDHTVTVVRDHHRVQSWWLRPPEQSRVVSQRVAVALGPSSTVWHERARSAACG